MLHHLAALVVLVVSAEAAPAFAQYATVDVANGGTISGKVSFTGAKPAATPETRDRNPDVCGTTAPDQTLIVGAAGGIKNVIVYLTDIKAGKALTPTTADLNQKACTYEPHVQALAVGSTLNVLNSDPLLHNIHATQGGATVFNAAMPATLKRIPRKLAKPGIITIKCDVHGWMSGAIGVMDNPYFAVTGDDGTFTLDGVPPGTYTVDAWQERLHDKTQTVTVAAGGTATANFSFAQ